MKTDKRIYYKLILSTRHRYKRSIHVSSSLNKPNICNHTASTEKHRNPSPPSSNPQARKLEPTAPFSCTPSAQTPKTGRFHIYSTSNKSFTQLQRTSQNVPIQTTNRALTSFNHTIIFSSSPYSTITFQQWTSCF